MKIKFLKFAKIEDTEIPEGSIVEMEDVSAKSFIESKDAIEYTDEVEGKEKSMAVKEIVEKSINVIVKDNKEVKMNDFLIGKMLKEVREKAVTGMSEGTAADGGAMLSTATAQLMSLAMEGSKIYPKCRKIRLPQGYNSCKIVTDNSEPILRATAPIITSPAEGGDKTATKLQFGNYTATLVKSVLYIPITEELLEDEQSLDGYIRDYMRGKMAADVDAQILNGSASTGFMGVTTAGTGAASYRVAQAWTTPSIAEVANFMRGVNPAFSDGAEWYMSPTQWFSTVDKLVISVANTNGMIVNPAAMTLMGKKVNVMAAMTSGAGVLYGNFSQYTIVEPNIQNGFKISEHIRFYNDEVVFRLVERRAGGCTFLARTLADGSSSAAFVCDDGLTS